jgi:UDP-glucose 4-epimerase
MNILLTGGNGYLGSHLAYSLPASCKLTILDIPLLNINSTLRPDTKRLDKSILDYDFLSQLFHQNQFDVVIHLAAKKNVQESLNFPILYENVNAEATSRIASLSATHGVKKFIFASSAAVYGNSSSSEKISENTLLKPLNPYGSSKVNAEKYLDLEVAQGSITSFISLRLFNLAGFGISDYSDSRQNSLFPTIAKNIVSGQPTRLNGFDLDTTDGSCVRDYVHILDAANAFVEILGTNFPENSHEIFNVSSGLGTSVLQVISLFQEVCGRAVPIDYCDSIAGDPLISIGDNSKLIQKTNWKVGLDVESMVISTWNSFSA